jgi:hypothetical protein
MTQRNITMRNLLVGFVLLIAGLSLTYTSVSQDATFIERPLEINLDGSFTTQAVLTLPIVGIAPYPTLILFHGSGPYDMDATYTTEGEEPVSTNFKLLAEELSRAGIAVLRFNKRGVLGTGDYDFAQIQASTLDQLILDAHTVITTALEQPEVDSDALYLYGWSEGAWVISNAAQTHPELAGLILQGAPDDNLATILPYQHIELGLPYLTYIIDDNQDGLLTLEEISRIPSSAVGLMATFYLYAQDSTPEAPKLNTFTDQNGDGFIDIENELRPLVEMVIGNYAAYLPQLEASYLTGDLIQIAAIPTLILHGEYDGWVPLRSAEAIANAAPDIATLITYPALGHALSAVETPTEDVFKVMDNQPIEDISAWILELGQ